MWTMENTDGFTEAQLDVINEVRTEMVAELPASAADGPIDMTKNIDDQINNAWNDGIVTTNDLRRAIAA